MRFADGSWVDSMDIHEISGLIDEP